MRYHFYTTSQAAWRGMLGAISRAQKSIYLEMYVFQDDTSKYDFFSALEQKAREGVRIILVLDAFGSNGLSSALVERLRKGGIEVLFFSFWFRRLHRKILIVDERIGFVGGVNISGRFAQWNDLQVRLEGKVVQSLLRSFVRVYRECGGKNTIAENLKKERPLVKARLWLVEHGIGKRQYSLRKHYEEHIGKAKHSITLITPYLVPHRWLIAHLHQAILRGVRVKIIVPEYTDHRKIIDPLNYYYLHLFSKLGAECLLSLDMNHAKAMLVDESVGTIGSYNLDTLSFQWNAEAGIFFNNPRMIEELRGIITKWETATTHFALGKHPVSRFTALLAFILRLF